MDNIHKRNALELSESQRQLLDELAKAPIVEHMPYRNADDADRLFDLLLLLAVKFVEVEVDPTSNVLRKLIFKLALPGMYARSVIGNVTAR